SAAKRGSRMSNLPSWAGDYAARQTAGAAGAPSWLAAVRLRALERFSDEGWPTVKQESWHHTSLAVLQQQAFALPSQDASSALGRPYTDAEPGHWMVFVDGVYAPSLSRIGAMPAGVTLTSLAQAMDDASDAVQQAFGTEADGSTPAALNLALAKDGAMLQLARGATLEESLHLVFIAASAGAASCPRNRIVAEAGSSAAIVEHYRGQGRDASFTNAVTRLQIDADANITHLKLQREDAQAFHLGVIDDSQAAGSVFNSHSLSFG